MLDCLSSTMGTNSRLLLPALRQRLTVSIAAQLPRDVHRAGPGTEHTPAVHVRDDSTQHATTYRVRGWPA